LQGRVVWVTGASSGLGEAMADALADVKQVIVVLSARNEEQLDRVRSRLVSRGVSRVLVVPLDLARCAADPDVARQAVDTVIQSCGKIDIMVHCAGLSMRGSVSATSLAVDRTLLDVNCVGAVALTKVALRTQACHRNRLSVCSSE
jgi:short-subunit dehydrogenase